MSSSNLFGVLIMDIHILSNGPSSLCKNIICILLTTFLTVITGTVRTPLIPTFLHREKNVTVMEGDRAVLLCAVRNLGTKAVTWRRLGYITPIVIGADRFVSDPRYESENVPYKDEWNLVIKRAHPKDTATYECQIGTKHKKLRRFVHLEVIKKNKTTDEEDPHGRAISISGPTIVDKGGVLELVCNVTGEDAAPNSLTWFLEGQKLLQTNERKHLVITDTVIPTKNTLLSSLRIRNVQMSYRGTYICHSPPLTTRHIVDVLNGEISPSSKVPQHRVIRDKDKTDSINQTVSRSIQGTAVFLRTTTGTVICVVIIQTILQRWLLDV